MSPMPAAVMLEVNITEGISRPRSCLASGLGFGSYLARSNELGHLPQESYICLGNAQSSCIFHVSPSSNQRATCVGVELEMMPNDAGLGIFRNCGVLSRP